MRMKMGRRRAPAGSRRAGERRHPEDPEQVKQVAAYEVPGRDPIAPLDRGVERGHQLRRRRSGGNDRNADGPLRQSEGPGDAGGAVDEDLGADDDYGQGRRQDQDVFPGRWLVRPLAFFEWRIDPYA